jgi:hypothetical protein
VSDDPTNPDEEPTYPDEPQTPDDPEAGHDDIMKRLVDYQRQLRQGVEPTEAAAVAWNREPREPGQTEQPDQIEQPDQTEQPGQLEQPEQLEQPQQPAQPSTLWGEPDVVDVSSSEPEAQDEAAAVRSEAREEVESFDEPADRVEILTKDEAGAGPARPWERPPPVGSSTTRTEVSNRIAQLEGTLDRLSRLLGDLRENFQGMAVTADERLAAIEAEIERSREHPDDPS